jgi:cytidylate kinase
MPVITMTRELGSRGKDVALALADELGLAIVHRELVEHQLAKRLDVGESAVHRYLEGKPSMFERLGLDRTDLSFCTAAEIFDLAAQGNVLIRGWGATHLLRAIPHIVGVRVCAPIDVRVKTLMERLGWDDVRRALNAIRENDAAHARTMHRLFDINWEDPLLYDLVLNTARVSIKDSADLIKYLVSQPTFEETAESHAKLVTLKVEAKIRSALRCNPITRDTGPSFGISLDPTTRKVTLTGAVAKDQFRHEVEQVVLAVPGVTQVDNQLVATAHYPPG